MMGMKMNGYQNDTSKQTDRQKHLAWCKERALEYVESGDLPNAMASMISDMRKRDDTAIDPMLAMLGMMEVQQGAHATRRWIEGFN